MIVRTWPILIGCLALGGAAGCSEAEGRPPVARIHVTPIYIRQNDAFQTAVEVDGSGSADEVDDPAGTRPLTFQWNLPADAMLVEGGVTAPRLVIHLRGDRPVEIDLAVTDSDDHLTAAASTVVGITLR
jgi:hypothetical protein